VADAALGTATSIADGPATAGEDGRGYSGSDALIDGATGAAFRIVGFGLATGVSVGARALFRRLAHVAEQARVAKVWKAANEKPYSGNPDEITCSNAGQDAQDAGSVVGRYIDMPKPRPEGFEAHHGVNSVWAKANVEGYSAGDAPSVRMRADPSHNATRGVFNSWRRSEAAGQQGKTVGGIDGGAVSSGLAWRLAEEQFLAAATSPGVVDEYFSQWNIYLGKVGWGG